MKKIAIFCVILLLVSSVFVFAGGNRQKDGKVELTFTLWGSAAEEAETQKALDAFNNSQNRIRVTARAIPWEAYVETLNIQAAAGQLPDVGMMMESAVLSFANRGLLSDLSAMYPSGTPRPMDSLAFKNAQGSPVGYSVANVMLMMFYNQDMLRNAGVTAPKRMEDSWDWDTFLTNASRLTLDNQGRNPGQAGFDRNNIVQYGVLIENLTWQLELWTLSNGGGFFSPDGKEVWIDRPQSIEAIQRIADLHLVHNVSPFSPGLTDDGVQRSLLTGTVAMTTNGTWSIGAFLREPRDAGTLNYGVSVVPNMGTKLTVNTGGPVVMFSQTKHPAEVMEFIRWYSSPDNNFGLIEAGIWMPAFANWFTDSALLDRWARSPAYPPFDEFNSAVIQTSLNYSRPVANYYTDNCDEFNKLLQSILGPVWTGQTTAQQAITSNIDALRRAHAGQ
jgi:multiple sugar transport system substrate-binding protein